MAGLFGLGAAGTAALLVAVVALIVGLASPRGRCAATAALGAVGRWPALIRAELRGAAPLQRDPAGDATYQTMPDIPPVTRGLPIIDRPDRG